MGYISKLAFESDRITAATLNGDRKEMGGILCLYVQRSILKL